jgi:SAM-dependent methyltransferase
MFAASADVYDLVYSAFKNYPAETADVAALIRRTNPGARTILDVACGTGEHARLLTDTHGFIVDGLDLEPGFVRIAQSKLPKGTVYEGDMTSFSLPGRYDIVLCLFSSIGYVRTLDNVQRTLERFAAHLAAGGIIIVEPWFAPGVLQPGRIAMTTAESSGVAVCRMSRMEVDDRISRLHFEYLIGRPGGIERASETHELGLFTTEEMIGCFERAGLTVEHDAKGPSGRGLFLAHQGFPGIA